LIVLSRAIEPLGPFAITITPRRLFNAFQMRVEQSLDMRRQRARGFAHLNLLSQVGAA
jgi:hypothetical protein